MAKHRFPKSASRFAHANCLVCGQCGACSAHVPDGECSGDKRHLETDYIVTGGFYACQLCGLVLDGDETPTCPAR